MLKSVFNDSIVSLEVRSRLLAIVIRTEYVFFIVDIQILNKNLFLFLILLRYCHTKNINLYHEYNFDFII